MKTHICLSFNCRCIADGDRVFGARSNPALITSMAIDGNKAVQDLVETEVRAGLIQLG